MQLPNSGLENHPDGTGNLNAIVNGNWAALDGLINPAAGMTASQAGFTVTSDTAVFTSANIGDTILFGNGATGIIQAAGLTTTASAVCTLNISQAVVATSFSLYHPNQAPYTALVRGLLKLTTLNVLQPGDMIAWSTTLNHFAPATRFNGSRMGTLFTGTADATLTNTVVATSVNPAGFGTLTYLTAQFAVGKRIWLKAAGLLSTALAAGTLRLQVKLGVVVIFDTGAVALTNSLAGMFWELDAPFTMRSIGGGGSGIGQGKFAYMPAATGAPIILPMTNAAAISIDTTADRALSLVATWGTANAANILKVTDFSLEVIN